MGGRRDGPAARGRGWGGGHGSPCSSAPKPEGPPQKHLAPPTLACCVISIYPVNEGLEGTVPTSHQPQGPPSPRKTAASRQAPGRQAPQSEARAGSSAGGRTCHVAEDKPGTNDSWQGTNGHQDNAERNSSVVCVHTRVHTCLSTCARVWCAHTHPGWERN